ncbi:hypothetical protein EDC94DRAFT_587903 [Helicostylum pulchrum]|nr:hypothetical protein EDC94DRAFT_587903 [Helicostylum pulchrum]
MKVTYVINFKKISRIQQDEVFQSALNIEAVRNFCKSYKLKFSQSIAIICGLVILHYLLEVWNSPDVPKELKKDVTEIYFLKLPNNYRRKFKQSKYVTSVADYNLTNFFCDGDTVYLKRS